MVVFWSYGEQLAQHIMDDDDGILAAGASVGFGMHCRDRSHLIGRRANLVYLLVATNRCFRCEQFHCSNSSSWVFYEGTR